MDDKDVIIARLEALVARQQAQIQQLTQRVRDLEDQVARLKKNSSNSSKPPSSDITKPPKDNPPPSGGTRKIGGQSGHPRHERPPFDASQIDQVVTHELPEATIRRRKLRRLPGVLIRQQVELLDKPYRVIEHRAARYITSDGRIVIAPMPPEVRRSGLLGPKMTALVGWMKGTAHISYSLIAEFFRDVLSLPVSRGELARRCMGMLSSALAPVYEELAGALRNEPVLGSDETGHEHAGKNYWTWCLRASRFTLFHIDASRGSKVLEGLLGKDYAGILTVDYFSANRAFASASRAQPQFCWAHLLREIKFLLGLGRAGLKRWAEDVLNIARKMFRLWHKREGLDPPLWRKRMEHLKRAFLTKLRRPPCHSEAMNLAKRFDRYGAPSYFRFLDHAGVEPTNNATERAIRQPVLDRRITQGTRSRRGIAWCQRVWTVAATCAQQGRSTFRFLRNALTAYLTGTPAPSLLPVNP